MKHLEALGIETLTLDVLCKSALLAPELNPHIPTCRRLNVNFPTEVYDEHWLTCETAENSIVECVAKVPSLDILVNNAGAVYNIPVADIDLPSRERTL